MSCCRTPYQRLAFHTRLRDEEYASLKTAPTPPEYARLPTNTYPVLPGVFAGEYPAHRYDDDPRRLLSFLDMGVRAFVDLTEPDERRFSSRQLTPYDALLRDLSAQRGLDVTYRPFPVRDLSAPAPAQMVQILDDIDAARAEGRPVYVHCKGGVGRSGTVAGCYLVRHGFTPEEALRQIARRLYFTYQAERLSPEMDEQRSLVLRWKSGQ